MGNLYAAQFVCVGFHWFRVKARHHDGIRFPTKTHMLEKYKGGRFVLKYKGSKGWERNRTTFTYDDYRFFEVKVEVSIDKG
jgi:hypothetical protein